MEIVGSDEQLACVGFAVSSAPLGQTVREARLKSLQVGVKEQCGTNVYASIGNANEKLKTLRRFIHVSFPLLPHELILLVLKKDVERGERTVAACDVLL